MTNEPGHGDRGAFLVTSLRPDVASRFAFVDPSTPAAIPQLCEVLSDSNPAHRRWAGEMLVLMGPAAAPAVPLLIELLRHSEAYARQKAADILSNLGPIAEPAVS